MEPPVLDLKHVRKVYKGKVEALQGIALQVPPGSVFGLLGPNGAGKSTLVKILTTIIRATECEGDMLGQPIGHKPSLQKVGYLPEHARFPDYLTGRQVVEYSAGMAGFTARQASSRVEALLELVGMRDWAQRKVRSYSKGMKQRVGIAQALVNDPKLLFLDEPTDGVDPEGRREIREIVKRMREEGRTVFINTHLLSELEQVADRVAILAKGALVREGDLEELTKSKEEYEIVLASPLSDELVYRLETLSAVVANGHILFKGGDPKQLQPVIDFLRHHEVVIQSIQRNRLSLEELFLEVVEQSRNEEPT
ncbi:MAG: ABC transporter ATP-binding protein [Akkermansiaceae bacterium]